MANIHDVLERPTIGPAREKGSAAMSYEPWVEPQRPRALATVPLAQFDPNLRAVVNRP